MEHDAARFEAAALLDLLLDAEIVRTALHFTGQGENRVVVGVQVHGVVRGLVR